MNRFALVLGALAAVGLVAWLLYPGVGRGSTRAAPVAAAPLDPVAEAELERVALPTGRSELPAAAHEPGPAATPARTEEREPEAPVHVRGRVVTRSGEGVPGVPIVSVRLAFSSRPGSGLGARVATSGAGGFFDAELTLAPSGALLESGRDSRFATLRAAHVRRESSGHEPLILVAPAVELAGTVVESGGAPVRGAQLVFELPLRALADFPGVLDETEANDPGTATDAEGRFTLARVPATEGARLSVRHAGFRALEGEAPLEPQSDLWFELERIGPSEPWLLGVVLTAEGRPAKGAKVQLDDHTTKTDADGRFGLEKGWANPEAPLVAAAKGFQPAVLPEAGAWMELEFPPAPVRLVLGGPTLTIRGVVLDAQSDPCRDWKVGLVDGTVMTPRRVPFDLVEDLARGKKVATKTDKRGAFELEGLLPRNYVVQAYQARTLLKVVSAPVPAGTEDLVLRLPADATLERLSGVVVGRDGTPVVGVEVASRLVTAQSGGAQAFEAGEGVTTDAAGYFELRNVPRSFVSLSVSGASVIPEGYELASLDPREDLRLSVARRCHFRVELVPGAAAGAPDALMALDSVEERLALYLFQSNGWSASTRMDLAQLGANTLGVSEDASTLVLLRGNTEVRRVPLALVPGEVTVVRGDG